MAQHCEYANNRAWSVVWLIVRLTEQLLDAEIVSALRGMARISPVLDQAVPSALAHLAGFPIRRMPLPPLLERMWGLRKNVTAYDAAYIALAERLRGYARLTKGKELP